MIEHGLGAANRYLKAEPPARTEISPGVIGDVVFNLIAAYEITKDSKYLARADHFAAFAQKKLFDPGSPLPKATSARDHYESVTRGDTLMMALLKLWQIRNKPDLKLSLLFCER